MTVQAARFVRALLSALTAGLMGTGTVILGSMTDTGQVKPGTWLIAGVSGVMFACKDLQSSLSTPPQISMPDERKE